MRNVLLATVALFLSFFSLSGQKLNSSNLILFEVQTAADGLCVFTEPRFLSGFNQQGYNNQPAFFSDSDLYFTLQSLEDSTQSDLVALDLQGKHKIPITKTRQSEYSPTLMPDGQHFSCVKVQDNGDQQLWAYPLDRSDGGFKLFTWLDNIGYHCWFNSLDAALFLVGSETKGHQLMYVNHKTRKTNFISSNPGRSLHRTVDNKLAYVTKSTESTWFIQLYDPIKTRSSILVQTRPNSEDFCILPNGTYLMGDGARIYQFNPEKDKIWQLAADLSQYGISKVTRMAVGSASKIVLVVE